MDPMRDESLIFELLELKLDVADNGSAIWFLQDLATEQDAEGAMVKINNSYFTLFFVGGGGRVLLKISCSDNLLALSIKNRTWG